MSTVDEIKAAAARLKPEEQLELYQWLGDSEPLRQLRLNELKRELAAGIEDLESGRARLYDTGTLDQLAAELKEEGRQRRREGSGD